MLSPSNSLRRARPLLGTLVEITAVGADGNLSAAIDAAFALLERVQRLMSFHDANSDVSCINRAKAGNIVRIDPHTYRVLEFARQMGNLSEGVFDIAIASVLVRSGFLPADIDLTDSVSADATYRDLDLLRNYQVRWQQKGLIDLGGIAKGYAVDCAIDVLRTHGITTGVVNAGGDLRCFGDAQSIHVRQPNDPTALAYLGLLSNCAIATSGGYFAGIEVDEIRLDPLVDPERQACTTWEESVSVVAPLCVTADALTKIVRLAPTLAMTQMLMIFRAQAIVIDHQSRRTCGAQLLQEGNSR